MSDPARGWRGLSLRARLVLVTVGGVAIALLAGGLAFYAALTVATDRTLDGEARAAARQVAALVEAGRVPSPLPVSGAQVVQVVDAEQRVVASSATADKLTPLLRPGEVTAVLAGEALEVPGARLGLAVPLRVTAVPARPPTGPVAVVVALPVGDVQASRAALRTGLFVAYPLLLAALAALAWRVVESTLRPVEALRAGAERISAGQGGAGAATARLPVPPAADEIRALALTLNEVLDRLAAARDRQRAFTADAAHELRSPLASLRTQLEVAERLGEGGDLPGELLPDVERLSRLVEDLLLLARTDATAPVAAREPVEVTGLLRELADPATAARVPVRVAAGPPATVLADREELRRALRNLVDNAVRHAGSAVELAVARGSGAVTVLVRDDGPGVPPEERERVFARFARRDDARSRDAGGSGLGLAIARELVARAGGSVRLADASPPWTLQAEVRLPARPDEPSDDGPAGEVGAAAVASSRAVAT